LDVALGFSGATTRSDPLRMGKDEPSFAAYRQIP